MLGALHIEMASVKMLGKWLRGSGWAGVMYNAGVTTQGVAESFLWASHVTRPYTTRTLGDGSMSSYSDE